MFLSIWQMLAILLLGGFLVLLLLSLSCWLDFRWRKDRPKKNCYNATTGAYEYEPEEDLTDAGSSDETQGGHWNAKGSL